MSVFEHLHMPSLGEATGWLSQRLWRHCAALAVVAMLLVAPSAALGGGDEDHAPPSAGPPGPWDGPFGNKVPYRPSGTHRCGTGKAEGAGPGSVLGLFVQRARCRDATRLVRAYQSCLDDARGRAGGCYDRVYRRCVQPVFLGRCRSPIASSGGPSRATAARSGACTRSEATTRPTSPASRARGGSTTATPCSGAGE